jgi:hypothetical protein
MHSKYLKRFSNKIQLMYTHISNDIKFDDSVEISKNKKKELIDEFVANNVDKELLRDFKTSIGSETNSEVSSDGSKSSVSSPADVRETASILSLSIPSPINISNRNTSNHSLMPSIPKTNYKSIFKNNIHKVTDMLHFCKTKPGKVIQPKMSEKDVEDMFYGIEESCDTIINQDTKHDYGLAPENIGLHINSFDEARPGSPIHFEGNNYLNEPDEIENIVMEKSEIGIDIADEKIEEHELEPPVAIEEPLPEPVPLPQPSPEPPVVIEEPEPVVIISEKIVQTDIKSEPIQEEPSEDNMPAKKKRAYKKKK